MYCFDDYSAGIYESLRWGIFSSELSPLIYYSHITAVVVTVLLGFFVYIHNRDYLPSKILLLIAISFSALSIIDLFLWTQVDSRILMFLWSFWLTLFIVVFLLSFYFLYTFIKNKDLPLWSKLVGGICIAAVEIYSATAYNLESFDVAYCNALEGSTMINTVFGLSFTIFVLSLIFGIIQIKSLKDRTSKRRALLATIGITLFLFSFSATAYIASIANIFFSSEPDVFILEQYGYFGMTVFIGLLTFMIVKYRAFSVKLIAAQALVASLVLLVASQYLFVRNTISQVLTGITLILVIGFGYLLVQSVKREIEARERIQKLAADLQSANEHQTTLIHFITHQVKGFFTKSRNIFDGLRSGDYGKMPIEAIPLIEEGFASDTKAVDTVQVILKAANIRKGTIEYKKEPLDIKQVVLDQIKKFEAVAKEKGIELKTDIQEGNFSFTGDEDQLEHAFRNLIDNSIKYTPKGSVTVSLKQSEKGIRFSVKDTGIGISPKDRKRLFTEGGRGEESVKVNVESTGYGLYIVKGIIEAHGGTVRAESAGPGKGSEFVVELPVR